MITDAWRQRMAMVMPGRIGGRKMLGFSWWWSAHTERSRHMVAVAWEHAWHYGARVVA